MNKWLAAAVLVVAIIVFFSGMVIGFRVFGEALPCVLSFAAFMILLTAGWLLFTGSRD